MNYIDLIIIVYYAYSKELMDLEPVLGKLFRHHGQCCIHDLVNQVKSIHLKESIDGKGQQHLGHLPYILIHIGNEQFEECFLAQEGLFLVILWLG